MMQFGMYIKLYAWIWGKTEIWSKILQFQFFKIKFEMYGWYGFLVLDFFFVFILLNREEYFEFYRVL